jgi:hypothetical protein
MGVLDKEPWQADFKVKRFSLSEDIDEPPSDIECRWTRTTTIHQPASLFNPPKLPFNHQTGRVGPRIRPGCRTLRF